MVFRSSIWVGAVILLLSPVLLVCLPFLLTVCGAVIGLNVCRATRWNPRRACVLLKLVAQEVQELLCGYVPIMSRVLWFYITSANRERIRCHIPYEAYYAAWSRRRARRVGSATCTPQSSPAFNRYNGMANSSSPLGTAQVPLMARCVLGLPPPAVGTHNGSFSTSASSSFASSPDGVPDSPASPLAAFGGATSFPVRGKASLCTLDVYGVREDTLRPVVVFVYGGAWGTGSKWYYATVAQNLRAATRCCVVVPDYPTYPSGTIHDMVDSIHAALQWTEDHIALHGGDPTQLVLVGHSAGAHLCALWSVRRAMAKTGVSMASLSLMDRGDYTPPVGVLAPPITRSRRKLPSSSGRSPDACAVDYTSGPDVKGLLLFSGVYDLKAHFEWETRRCVEAVSTMRGATDGFWSAVSPTTILSTVATAAAATKTPIGDTTPPHTPTSTSSAAQHVVHLFPCSAFPSLVQLYHDAHDATVNVAQSHVFRSALLAGTEEDGGGGGWCPAVVPFPHGHGDVVVGPMELGVGGQTHPFIVAVATALQQLVEQR